MVRWKIESRTKSFREFIKEGIIKKVDSNYDAKKRGPADVDAYLSSVPQEQRAVLENLRQAIKAAAPKAEEIISYQIPTYKFHGPLVHFMAHKNYCSFIVVDKSILENYRNELKDYDTSGTTIHFSAENPLPSVLVKKIVRARVEENVLHIKHKIK